MTCLKCQGFMLYKLDEQAWGCLNCGRREGYGPLDGCDSLSVACRRGSPAFRAKVADGMRKSWAIRKERDQ